MSSFFTSVRHLGSNFKRAGLLECGTSFAFLIDMFRIQKEFSFFLLILFTFSVSFPLIGGTDDCARNTQKLASKGPLFPTRLKILGGFILGIALTQELFFPLPKPTIDVSEVNVQKSEWENRAVEDKDKIYFVDPAGNVFYKYKKSGKVFYFALNEVESLSQVDGVLIAKKRDGKVYHYRGGKYGWNPGMPPQKSFWF